MEAEQQKRIGRPPFQPTDEQRRMVQVLIGLCMDQECIARDILQIDKQTMRKHFKEELQRGVTRTVANLKLKMYQHAQNGSVRAIAYLLDRTGAWPVLENGSAQQPQQVHLIVRGGLAGLPINGNGSDAPAE